jgi:FkbM family methyltransferase
MPSKQQMKSLHSLMPLLQTRSVPGTIIQMLLKGPVIRSRLRGISTPLCWRRHNSDMQTLLQLFDSKELGFPLDYEPASIIDAGANVGYSSVYFANRFPNTRILAIEPEVANCDMFAMNCAAYPHIQLLRAGLWWKETNLRISNPSATSWMFQVCEAEKGTPGAIQATTVPALMSQLAGQRVDLLKIDIEGSEKEVFENSSDEWLGRVRTLAVETHDRFKPGSRDAVLNAISRYPHTTRQSGEYLVVDFKQSPEVASPPR